MLEALQPALIAFGSFAGMGFGLSAVFHAYSEHKIAMRLLDQGIVPPPRERLSLFGFPKLPKADTPAE